MRSDILSFSSEAAFDEMRKSLQDGRHHYKSKKFEGIYVAVSALPTIDNSRCRELFGKGYTAFLNVLLNESGFTAGDRDLAHWIYCYDGKQQKIHLTFLPSYELINTQGPQTVTTFAQDLMSKSVKREAGIA